MALDPLRNALAVLPSADRRRFLVGLSRAAAVLGLSPLAPLECVQPRPVRDGRVAPHGVVPGVDGGSTEPPDDLGGRPGYGPVRREEHTQVGRMGEMMVVT